MEDYLQRCLDSLIIKDDELMSKLDVIVVNDGSKDQTSEIAHMYADRFPRSIRVIDKENGHYGSCVNSAIPVAYGKYFRILDADDWFDTEALKLFIRKLQYIDTDCVCTNCIDVIDDKEHYIRISDLPYETEIELNNANHSVKYIHLHHISYRTKLLQHMGYRQTEGICYTDEEFSYYPLIECKSIYLIDLPLYHYFIGRPGQSVDKEVSRRNKHHFFIVTKRMIETTINPKTANAVSFDIRWGKIKFLMEHEILPNYVLFRKMNKDESGQLLEMLRTVKSENHAVYNLLTSATVRGIPVYKIWMLFPRLVNPLYYSIFKFLR